MNLSTPQKPSPFDIRFAIFPLRLIFWGGLLVIFDITFSQTVNGSGFKFDVLNDAVGYAMIAYGVFQLSQFVVDSSYEMTMLFLKIVVVICVFEAIADHFIMPTRSPLPLQLFGSCFGLACIVAIVLFCNAMRCLCLSRHLSFSATSWQYTLILFLVIYVFPLGLFYLLATAAIATRQAFNINLGPLGLVLLPIFAFPVIHLFISTSRMQKEAGF